MMSETIESFRSMCLTKDKRDEFLIEIRKKKNEDLITQKRHILSNGLEESKSNTLVQEEEMFEMPSVFPEASAKTEQDILFFQQKFYEAITSEAWDDLTVILNILRESLVNKTVSGRQIIEIGIIPHLLELLKTPFATQRKLQVEAVCLVAQLLAGPIEEKIPLINLDCIKILCHCLLLNNEEVHENAMWGLANIASEDDLRYRDAILEQGTLKEVVKQVCQPPKRISYSRSAMWLISTLLRGYPFPHFNQTSVALTVLAQLIHHPDLTTQHYTLMSLMYITEEKDEDVLKEIASYGFITKIIKLIGSQDEKISLYALHIAGNFATGDIEIKKQFATHNIFQTLPRFINCRFKDIRKEACYIIRNLLTDGFRDADNSINELMPLIIERVNDESFEVRLEAACCIRKFVISSTNEEVQILVSRGVIDALIANLRDNFDSKLILNVLVALITILEYGEQLKQTLRSNNPYAYRIWQNNAVGLIDKLRNHQDRKISRRAVEILETYFSVEEMECS